MKVEEKIIRRLTIEYDNTVDSTERDEVFDFLDARFGRYNYHIPRMGPKPLGNHTVDPAIGQMIVEVTTVDK